MFDHLNDILFNKRGDQLNNVDHETDYSPYMINRWLSMYSDDMCNIINSTVNWLDPVFKSKRDHYKFLLHMIPRSKRKFIKYIKKHKQTEPDKPDPDTPDVNILARNLELSVREVKYLLQQ